MDDQNYKVQITTVKGKQYVYLRSGDKKQYLGPIEMIRELVDELNAMGINKAGVPFTSEDIAKAKEMMAAAERAMKEIEAKKKEVEGAMREVEAKKRGVEAAMKEVEAKKREVEKMMRQAREMMKKAEEAMKQARRPQEACSRNGNIAEDIEWLQKGLDALKQSLRFNELGNRIGVIRAIASAARLGDESAISHMFNFIAFLDGILGPCEEDVCKGFKKYLANLFRYKGEGIDIFEMLYNEIMEDLRYALERAKKRYVEQTADSGMHV